VRHAHLAERDASDAFYPDITCPVFVQFSGSEDLIRIEFLDTARRIGSSSTFSKRHNHTFSKRHNQIRLRAVTHPIEMAPTLIEAVPVRSVTPKLLIVDERVASSTAA
jgi:hypothetical protein